MKRHQIGKPHQQQRRPQRLSKAARFCVVFEEFGIKLHVSNVVKSSEETIAVAQTSVCQPAQRAITSS